MPTEMVLDVASGEVVTREMSAEDAAALAAMQASVDQPPVMVGDLLANLVAQALINSPSVDPQLKAAVQAALVTVRGGVIGHAVQQQ